MAIQQLSVFIENRQGRLAAAVKTIAEAGINIRAMSIADSKDFGILRLIVADTNKAKAILREENLINVTDVIAVKMDDKEGALYNILKVFDENSINVEYSYAFTATEGKGAYVVFRVDDVVAAEKILADAGFDLLDREVI